MRNPQTVLADIIEAFEGWEANEPEPTIDVDGQHLSIRVAVGRLWRCRQTMPNRLRRNVLDLIRHGEKPHTEITLATYAQAARILKLRIVEATAA